MLITNYGEIQVEAHSTEDVFYAQASLTSILSKPYNKAFKDSKPDDVNVDVLAVFSAFGKELLNLPPGLNLSNTMVKPNTLCAHIRAQPTTKIEVWASGDRLWHGDYTKGEFHAGQQTSFHSTYETYLRGHSPFKGYSADAEQPEQQPAEEHAPVALFDP
ncbi:uncharacterized protein FTOL_08584 [Fusarium torulosum]|uniref:Uncharacterized protein n=1 Tax=Fusarium torulosum TaxID=33205 RepID=A0AAE8MDJ3_9HYPO|nr:uncharacterized protein FTOL_08584 [Fusarium torulosum]